MGFWKKLFGGKKNPHSNISQRGESVRRNIYETVSIAPADQVRLIELEAEIRKMAEPEVDVRRHKEFAAAACHRASQDIASLMAWPVEFGTTGLVDFAGLTKMIADLERFRHLPFKFPFEERIKKLKEMMAILQKYRREPDIVQSEAAVPSVTGIHEATPITPAEKTRLAQLEAEIQKMAEPKLNGIETKEYYAHMGAQVLAGMMTFMSGDDVELTDHDFTDLTKRVADIERQDLKGSTFKFPWPERIKRLKEMNAIVQRKRGQPRIAQSEEQQPAAFETQNPQQHDKVKPTTPARNTGRAAEISLHRAAGAGDFNAINHSITNGAGVDEIDEMGLTPLTWAAGQGHVKAAAALIANGANINAVDPNK